MTCEGKNNIILYRGIDMSSRTRAILVSLMMCAMTLSGCLHLDNNSQKIIDDTEEDTRIFVTNSEGLPVELPPLPLNFVFSDVGEDGPEPSIGITSTGCIFFIALEKPMRSCDHGLT